MQLASQKPTASLRAGVRR